LSSKKPPSQATFDKVANESGSLALAMIFTTAGGILFALLFFNLVQFVGATGAVKEAARVTARCITPTDPDCVAVQTAPGDSATQDWYGYSTPFSPVVDLSIQTMRYNASMTRETYGADYTSYTMRVAQQEATLRSYEVPVYQEVGPYVIPAYEVDAVFVSEDAFSFNPRFTPNFPAFDQDARDTQRTTSQWRSLMSPYPFEVKHFAGRITAGDTTTFDVGPISVPRLAGGDAATCANPGDCRNAAAAGDSQGNNFRENAYVAIKALSRVRAVTGRTSVKWGSSSGGPGLLFQRLDASGAVIPFRDADGRNYDWYCLGGRSEFNNLTTESKGYNMWLRGPAGANGGPTSNSICPGGRVNHQALKVPRGGSFRIRAFLSNTGGNDLLADVDLAWYYDQYEFDPGKNERLACRKTVEFGSSPNSICRSFSTSDCDINCDDPRTTACLSFSARPFKLMSCKTLKKPDLNKFSCQPTPESSPLRLIHSLLGNTLAACSTPPSPASNAPLNQNSSCGFEAIPKQKVQVANILGSCPAATPVDEQFTCEQAISESGTGDPTSCPSLYARKNELALVTELINQSQSGQAFSEDAEIIWGAKTPLPPITALTPYLNGQRVSGDSLSSRRHSLQNPANFIEQFQKKNGDTPPANEFLSAILSESPEISREHGLSELASAPEQYITPRRLSSETIKLSRDYPFKEAVREIYYGQIDNTRGWDFEPDCQYDAQCEGNFQAFNSEEQMLRFFAANEIPEAADEQYTFTSGSVFHGNQHYPLLDRENLASRLDEPDCTPFRSICINERPSNQQKIYIGRADTRPEICDDGSYFDCYSEPVGTENLDVQSSEDIDLELASLRGLSELRRIVPYAKICSLEDSGCTRIEIDTSSGRMARISVTYQMPLIFPLDIFVGARSIPISHTTEELIERRALGAVRFD
jgi:hypothetical protein